MARKKEKKELPESNWMDTYSDCITLLLTFFVLMYSMSSVDAAKLQSLSNALNSVLTGNKAESILEYDLYEGEVPLVGGENKVDKTVEESQDEESTLKEVQEFVADRKSVV